MQRREQLYWIVLATTALLPRLVGAAVRLPWHDEYYTAWAARLPLHDLVAALRHDSGPPLPYLLAHLLARTGLNELVAARAIAVVVGVAAVLVAAVAARRAFGATAGWWTGALVATHPLAVAWACEGRAYALLLLAAALAWERLESLRVTGRGAFGLAAAIALACWSHGLGLILAAALLLAAATLPEHRRRPSLAATAFGLATFLPWLPVAAQQPAAATAWMDEAWQTLSWPTRAFASVRLLPPLADFRSAVDLPSAPFLLQVMVTVVCLGLLASARLRIVPAMLFALPAAALPILTALGVPVFYGGRGEALFFAPALAFLASGASRGRVHRAMAASLVAAGIVTVTLGLSAWAASGARPEAKVARMITRAMPSGGTVVTSGYWWLDLWYHLNRDESRFALIEIPRHAQLHPGWYADGMDTLAPNEIERLTTNLAPRRQNVAVIVTPGLACSGTLRAMALHLGLKRAAVVPAGELYLPARSAANP